MKANELMIGDWVRRHWACTDTGREVVKDFQITEIRKNGETLYAWGKSGNMGRVEELEPIPITPKILEKNGFGDVENDGMELTHFYIRDRNSRRLVHIGTNNKGIYWVNTNYNDIYGLKYVHELQHAFRLFKLEKDIVL